MLNQLITAMVLTTAAFVFVQDASACNGKSGGGQRGSGFQPSQFAGRSNFNPQFAA
jgi:hypothetical protein